MNIQELQTGILDINNKYNIDFSCKQLDDIILKIIVYDKSVQADLSNYNCRLKAFKSDQVLLIQNTNISIKDNVVTIKASKQLTTTVGIVKAELQFINKTTLEKKSTFYINIEVVASVLDVDGTVSTPTCTILEEIDHKLDEIENISNVLEEAKEVRDELKGTTIPNATNINSNLEDNTNNANNKIIEVKNIISSASNKIEEVKTSIINATNTKDNLAATTKEKIEELKDAATLEKESIISTAFNKIKEVETCINNADSSKKELDLSKTNADISKENLDTANTLAEKNIEELNSLGNVTDLAKNVQTNTTDITKLKTDVEDNTSQLKDCAKNLSQLSNSNILKNGGFDIWQRGDAIVINSISNTYTADRWYATLSQITSGYLTVAKNTVHNEPETSCCLEINCSTLVTTGGVILSQMFESTDVVNLRGKQVTFSVYLKVLSESANCKLTIQDGANINSYPGTSTSNDEKTINVTTEWQRFTITHTMQTDANSLIVRLFTPDAFKGVLYVSRSKHELGSVATPFIPRLYGEELALCQRYCEPFSCACVISDKTSSENIHILSSINYKVTKRIKPTVKFLHGNWAFVTNEISNKIGIYPDSNENFIYPHLDTTGHNVEGINIVIIDGISDAEIY